MSGEYIYRVAFKQPPAGAEEGRTEFFFHSLAAIYDTFTAAEIGCKVTRLWNIGVSHGTAYEGRLCSITREPIARKKRRNAPNFNDNSSDDKLHAKEK